MNILIYAPYDNYENILKKMIENDEYQSTFVRTEDEFFKELEKFEDGIVLFDVEFIVDYELKIYDILNLKKENVYFIALINKEDRFSLSEALRMGIDDYLIKGIPYSAIVSKLYSVKRFISKYENIKSITKYKLNNIVLDINNRTVTKDGNLIELTNREFKLLEYLVQNKNRIVPRNELKPLFNMEEDENSNIIDVYINFLRKKLSDDTHIDLIRTVRGIGYTIQEN